MWPTTVVRPRKAHLVLRHRAIITGSKVARAPVGALRVFSRSEKAGQSLPHPTARKVADSGFGLVQKPGESWSEVDTIGARFVLAPRYVS